MFYSFLFQIRNALSEIGHLKVFSHEIHQIFENDLAVLGSLKQLKYFYNLPIGQLFEALRQLYGPNPNSHYWKACQSNIYNSEWAPIRVCDFLKVVFSQNQFQFGSKIII